MTIHAVVKDRRLKLDVPVDWPDGTEVEIHPLGKTPTANLDQRLRKAAESLKDLYEPGGELTEWTALDAEDFHDEPA